MKPKVMILYPRFFVYGGAERVIVQLCNYLTNHDYPNVIVTTQMLPELTRDLLETRYLETGSERNLIQTARSIFHKFDIINPHNHPTELYIYPKKVKSVWQCNEPPTEILKGRDIPDEQKKIVREYISKSVVISEFDKRRFTDIYGIEPILNHPGVSYEYFSQEVEPRDRYGLRDSFVILQCAYLTFTKNQVKSVEIFADIKEKIDDAKLVLAGYDKDPYKFDVMNKAIELEVEDDVIFTGYIKKDKDFRDLYSIADVHIAPYLSQGGWLTTFEAVSAGLPVIVSNEHVGSKIVKDNKLGVVTNIDNFSNEILRIYDNLAKERHRTMKVRKWIRDNLSWDKFCERYVKIFEDVYNESSYSNNDY